MTTWRAVRAASAGLRAALETPAWLSSDRFGTLLTASDVAAGGVGNSDAPHVATALRVTRLVLRILSPLRRLGGPWRNTCLHRSVAGCLVLRRHGVTARVRLGARSDAGTVAAHAWVEDAEGHVLVDSPLDHTPLTPAV
jgi:hypothetical protein